MTSRPMVFWKRIIRGSAGRAQWRRSRQRKNELAGLAVASDERIEAYLLYMMPEAEVEIVSLRSVVEDGAARLKQLLSQLCVRDRGAFRFPKVHPGEMSKNLLDTLGFRPANAHLLYAVTARWQ